MLIEHILRRNCSKLSPQSSTLIKNFPPRRQELLTLIPFPSFISLPLYTLVIAAWPYVQHSWPVRPILTSDRIPHSGNLYGARGFPYCRAACSELFSGSYPAPRSINLSSSVSFGPSLGPSPSSQYLPFFKWPFNLGTTVTLLSNSLSPYYLSGCKETSYLILSPPLIAAMFIPFKRTQPPPEQHCLARALPSSCLCFQKTLPRTEQILGNFMWHLHDNHLYLPLVVCSPTS